MRTPARLQVVRRVARLQIRDIEEAILDGIIPNDYDAALKYLYEIKDDILKKYKM